MFIFSCRNSHQFQGLALSQGDVAFIDGVSDSTLHYYSIGAVKNWSSEGDYMAGAHSHEELNLPESSVTKVELYAMRRFPTEEKGNFVLVKICLTCYFIIFILIKSSLRG